MKKRKTMKKKHVSEFRKTQFKVLKNLNAMKRDINEIRDKGI